MVLKSESVLPLPAKTLWGHPCRIEHDAKESWLVNTPLFLISLLPHLGEGTPRCFFFRTAHPTAGDSVLIFTCSCSGMLHIFSCIFLSLAWLFIISYLKHSCIFLDHNEKHYEVVMRYAWKGNGMNYPTIPSNCRREQWSTRCVPLKDRVGVLRHSTLCVSLKHCTLC